MARTYKQRSKKKPNKSHKKMHRYRRKFKRAGVGSLTSLRAAKTIQSAFRENTTRRKASALRQRHSAKTIQRSANKAFDFLADDCTICLESMALKSKVAPISCGHGMHKKCRDDLLKSEAFKIPQNRKCPMCRAPAPEFQVIEDVYDLDTVIREVVERHVIESMHLPRVLATPENINKLIRLCKFELNWRRYERSEVPQQIRNYLSPITSIITNRWNSLNSKLDIINSTIRNKTGQIKSRIGKPALESIRDRYLPFVLASRLFIQQYNIDIPDITNRQIADITTLFREKNIAMPTDEELYRLNRQLF